MGADDYCAVYGCSNSRRYKNRLIKKDHVGILRWHSPKNEKDMKSWGKMLNRGGDFKMSMSTKVCSNHFAAGYCADHCRVPTLYLRGYESGNGKTPKRLSPKKRLLFSPENPCPKRPRNTIRRDDDEDTENISTFITPSHDHHNYECFDATSCSRCTPVTHCERCKALHQKYRSEINLLHAKLAEKETELQNLKNFSTTKQTFSYETIKDDANIFKFYTGLQNSLVFEWLYNKLLPSIKNMNSKVEKKKKRGPKMKIDDKNCFLLTLMRIRVGLPEKDLGVRFDVSQSVISRILSKWIPFLSENLSFLIHWPSREDVNRYYPKCFKKYKNVIGIIDCTEGIIEKPSLAKAQSQTYSAYKSRNTWKKLICITPAGTISFVSKCYGGCASDRFITEDCKIIDNLQSGDKLMADKGFNISDLLISKGCQLVIPPFLREKGKFSKSNCRKTSNIAKARIHVERAIARIKDFRILQGIFPLTLKYLLDDIFLICCALTNLAPALVPIDN